MFVVWMEILKEVPNSILWLLQGSGSSNMHAEATRLGVDPMRIIFKKSIPKLEHIKRLREEAHLLLDTTIYGAHTSAGDALWAGVPIVTLMGTTMPSRVCASMVTAAGFADSMITYTIKEYKWRAIHLATHPEEYQNLRERVEATRNHMPLFDTPNYVKDFEVMLQETWRLFNLGRGPQPFNVATLSSDGKN
eukprot:TRINITY_DN9492_c0_g1_i2.p1 TRINITY_DN9492_c0_g1~~TRINITY_DN9492_c0_g1_i2.p1  ORF type:complete len:192 (-),score=44.62 TRINITY_DN9492_c0_g1_i2:96-671(-)